MPSQNRQLSWLTGSVSTVLSSTPRLPSLSWVLTLFKLFARARSSLEEAKLGVILLAEVTVNWVCTNIVSGHIESGVEARGKLMTVLLSDKFLVLL